MLRAGGKPRQQLDICAQMSRTDGCAQNKLEQKKFFQRNRIPVGSFIGVDTAEDLQEAAEHFGYPLMLKSCRCALCMWSSQVLQHPPSPQPLGVVVWEHQSMLSMSMSCTLHNAKVHPARATAELGWGGSSQAQPSCAYPGEQLLRCCPDIASGWGIAAQCCTCAG